MRSRFYLRCRSLNLAVWCMRKANTCTFGDDIRSRHAEFIYGIGGRGKAKYGEASFENLEGVDMSNQRRIGNSTVRYRKSSGLHSGEFLVSCELVYSMPE
jgi:hypothetical protein